MKLFCWFLGLAFVFPYAQLSTQAASAKHSSNSGKTAHVSTFARNPYLGAIVIEASSGTVLFEDQADARGCPASLLKMMDLLLVLEKVERGELSLRQPVPVSAAATKTGPSKVWLAQNETFSLDEMLYAMMVHSANDAAVAVAQKAGGSTPVFVQQMNHRAKELGMNSTVFHTVNGLPAGHGQEPDVTTARDMALLSRELLKHRDTLRYTNTRERQFRPNAGNKTVVMHTHNHLLGAVEGCDGLKTGYTAQAGFSIAVTAARGGQRIIAVVLDSVDSKTRDAKARELVEKGFAGLHRLAAASPATSHTGSGAQKTK
jgi:D-alanyl-D-alanine carboxypeptidase (penicillin-binding protein 5/6)